ncbi:mechanosensitive ion channel family protein [bacterium]|nr:mechanosensitive ion channel family protein [bacterium]
MSVNWEELFKIEDAAKWLATSGIRIAAILVGALIITKIATALSRRAEQLFDDDDPSTMNEREKRAATLGKVIRNIIRVATWVAAALMVLLELGIDIAPLLAGVGVIGLAIGFGAQSLVKDVVAGLFILIEGQFDVGDVIRAAGAAGKVERITLRATTLRDSEGKVHIIPNGRMDVVTNMTRKFSRFVIDIGVGYEEDVDEVMVVLKEVGDEMMADPKFAPKILEPLNVLGVQDFADSAVIIRALFTTKPIEQWGVGREFRRRIKKTFDARGISIPFPQHTLHFADAPAGQSVRVQASNKDEETPDV